MIYSEYDRELVRKNICFLRKGKKLRQRRLGFELHMATNTISQYETGKRPINEETIRAYSKYFGIPVEVLLTKDLEQDPQGAKFTVGIDEYDLILNNLYPLVVNDEALKDPSFKQGYDIFAKLLDFDEIRDELKNEEIIKQIRHEIVSAKEKRTEDISYDEIIQKIDLAISFLRKVEKDSLKPIVSANLLRLIYMKLDVIVNKYSSIDYSVENDGNISTTIHQDPFLSQRCLEMRNSFINEYIDEVAAHVKTLKADPSYFEFGDYYFAIQLILDFNCHESIEKANELREDLCKSGLIMMAALSEIDNPYATAFLDRVIPCIF